MTFIKSIKRIIEGLSDTTKSELVSIIESSEINIDSISEEVKTGITGSIDNADIKAQVLEALHNAIEISTKDVNISSAMDDCGSSSVIEHSHHEIHEGNYWFCDDQSASLGSGDSKYYLFTTPDENNFFHSFPQFFGTGEFEVQNYENVTVSTNGTEIPLLNRNRPLAGTSTFKFYKDPTGMNTASAIKLRDIRVGSGKAIGESRAENEFILKKNTLYGIKITARAAGVVVSTHMNGYTCGVGG